MSFQKKSIFVFLFSLISFVLFFQFSQIDTLLLLPIQSAESFLNLSPFITINNLIIQQPSSSFLIYLLAIITIGLGIEYLYHRKNDFSIWLGFNFVFWGIGAFLAGLSYQSFGYYLKCVGYDYCTFTNWVELLYMSFTVLSINALLVSYIYIIDSAKIQSFIRNFSLSSVILYTLFQGIGMILPNQFMVSYEGMLVFLSPNIIIMMVLSYKRIKESLHKKLFILWILFLGVNMAYFVALFAQQGPYLLSNFNIWFNENDTLHVVLMLWMLLWRWMIPAKK